MTSVTTAIYCAALAVTVTSITIAVFGCICCIWLFCCIRLLCVLCVLCRFGGVAPAVLPNLYSSCLGEASRCLVAGVSSHPPPIVKLCIMTFKVDIDKVTTLISRLTVFSWYTLSCEHIRINFQNYGMQVNIMECYLPKECAAHFVIMRFHHVRWWEVLFSCGSVLLVLSCSPLHVQDGQTALYIASSNGHYQIVEELLTRGANVNHQIKVSILMWCMFLHYYDPE